MGSQDGKGEDLDYSTLPQVSLQRAMTGLCFIIFYETGSLMDRPGHITPRSTNFDKCNFKYFISFDPSDSSGGSSVDDPTNDCFVKNYPGHARWPAMQWN